MCDWVVGMFGACDKEEHFQFAFILQPLHNSLLIDKRCICVVCSARGHADDELRVWSRGHQVAVVVFDSDLDRAAVPAECWAVVCTIEERLGDGIGV